MLLVEIKSTEKVSKSDFKSLDLLGKDLDSHADKWVLSRDPLEQKFGTCKAIYWRKALDKLFVEPFNEMT